MKSVQKFTDRIDLSIKDKINELNKKSDPTIRDIRTVKSLKLWSRLINGDFNEQIPNEELRKLNNVTPSELEINKIKEIRELNTIRRDFLNQLFVVFKNANFIGKTEVSKNIDRLKYGIRTRTLRPNEFTVGPDYVLNIPGLYVDSSVHQKFSLNDLETDLSQLISIDSYLRGHEGYFSEVHGDKAKKISRGAEDKLIAYYSETKTDTEYGLITPLDPIAKHIADFVRDVVLIPLANKSRDLNDLNN